MERAAELIYIKGYAYLEQICIVFLILEPDVTQFKKHLVSD